MSQRSSDPLRRAIESLRQDFPGKSYSWIRRAVLRLGDVEELQSGLYLVEGRRELGDWKPLYQVWFSEREKRWYCTCYFSRFGQVRSKEICTHVAAVMLFHRYKKALERAERKSVYVAEGEIACNGKIEANGEVHLKPVGARDLTFYVAPRYKFLVVSPEERVIVKCNGDVVYEAEGEEVPLATARFLVERFYEK